MRTLIPVITLLVSVTADALPPSATRSTVTSPSARPQSEVGPVQQTPQLAEENKSLRKDLAALKESKAAAEKTIEELNAELRRLNTELISIRQASMNALQIQSERDNLQENVINLERDLEVLKRAKRAAEEDHRQSWLLIGAGVLFAGIVLGVLLPQISWRRGSSWDSF